MGVRRAGRLPPQTRALRRAYELMRARFGHQHWWPGETPFEVCVGAILTQNTAWSNVERAIARLKAADVLEPRKLFTLPETKLAELIRPAGYFNVKARRLRAFLQALVNDLDHEPGKTGRARLSQRAGADRAFLADGALGQTRPTSGCLGRLFAGKTSEVRERLLAISGVGPETADSMLLYAGGQHSFVIDAYTRRIFARHGWAGARPKSEARSPKSAAAGRQFKVQGLNPDGLSYDELKALCESALHQKAGRALLDYWQDYHAQLVMVGKHFCRAREPRCAGCPLKPLLPRAA